MRRAATTMYKAGREPHSRHRALWMVTAVISAVAMLSAGYVAFEGGLGGGSQAVAAETVTLDEPPVTTPTIPTTTTPTSTTTSSSTTTAVLSPEADAPPHADRYLVPSTEAEPEAKQLAVDIAQSLTTYEMTDDHLGRLGAFTSVTGGSHLVQSSEPLVHPGSWSRGQVIYPQLGGLTAERASVMVVVRQTVGSGPDAAFSVVRTLDVRLVAGDGGWEFDFLSSAGGTFDRIEDLALAHAVASDPRIEMPDSSRLDIRNGLVSPLLLRVMAEMADRTPYGVVVLVTGHPHHVFETDRISHHTVGLAVDIYRVGDRLVIDDRGPDSATKALVEWLYNHPDVRQVGSPWDLDGQPSRRSFTDPIHEDHIHLAVNDD